MTEKDKEINELRREVARLEKAQRWIPCSERLPETHKEASIFEDDYKCSDAVIVSLAEPFEGDVVVIATYDEGHDEELRYGWGDAFYGEALKVTAWMPLPEPYKEDKHETD